MTISTSTRTAGPFLGNGVTTVLPFTFKVFSTTDLVLTNTSATGIDTTLVLGTHYTVTLNANQDTSPGGNVTMLIAPPTGEKTTAVSAVPDTQTNVFTIGGAWSPTVMNSALDKLTILVLQALSKLSRAIKIPASDGTIPLELPTASIRANSIMAFDNAGYPILISQPAGTSINYPNVQGPNGSSLVGFVQSGTGAVTRTAQSKMRDVVSFLDFGAVGDGVTNDRAAILAALNSGALVVDGGGLTYKINSNITITASNILIQNAIFDASSITTGGATLTFAGTQSAGVALTADISTGVNVISVGSTAGFIVDGYAWLSSNTVFDITDSVSLGQIVKIKSIDSAVSMTIHSDVLYDFTTAASASIAKITTKKSITLDRVALIGANTGAQSAVLFEKCEGVHVTGCRFDYFYYASILFDRCVNAEVSTTAIRYARDAGTGYGVSIGNGCYGVRVSNCYGEDQRHMVTIGDNDGVNLFVTVSDCHAAHQRDAGFDSHPSGDFVTFNGNTVELVAAQSDGIIFQGLNCVISNNTVVGNVSTGIRHQLLPEIGTGSCVIQGNSIENTGGTASTDTAIYVAQESGGGAQMTGVVISNNRIDGAIEHGVYIFANSGNVKTVSISGNVLTTAASVFACSLRANNTFSVEDFTITGNVFKSTGTHGLDLLGSTAPSIKNGAITGNIITGGTNGIRMSYAQNIVETANYCTGGTKRVYLDTGTTGLWLDRQQSLISTATNSTYVVTEQDEYIIANRAGTITMTLPDPVIWSGRELTIKTIQAQLVDSASANVAPITDSVAGTGILPATDGAWARLKSNGTNWVIMQKG